MVTKQQLDDAIATLPGLVATSVESALVPILQPIIAKMGTSTSEDFSTELASLETLPAAISSAVAASITTALTPPAAPVETPPVVTAPTPPVEPPVSS